MQLKCSSLLTEEVSRGKTAIVDNYENHDVMFVN